MIVCCHRPGNIDPSLLIAWHSCVRHRTKRARFSFRCRQSIFHGPLTSFTQEPAVHEEFDGGRQAASTSCCSKDAYSRCAKELHQVSVLAACSAEWQGPTCSAARVLRQLPRVKQDHALSRISPPLVPDSHTAVRDSRPSCAFDGNACTSLFLLLRPRASSVPSS